MFSKIYNYSVSIDNMYFFYSNSIFSIPNGDKTSKACLSFVKVYYTTKFTLMFSFYSKQKVSCFKEKIFSVYLWQSELGNLLGDCQRNDIICWLFWSAKVIATSSSPNFCALDCLSICCHLTINFLIFQIARGEMRNLLDKFYFNPLLF